MPSRKSQRPADGSIRLLLCFEYTLWNELLEAAWRMERGVQILAALAPRAVVAGAARGLRPHVALTNVEPSAKHWNLFLAMRAVLRPARILAIGAADVPHAARLLRAGARGYLYPDTSLELLRKAILHVHRGELWADHRLASHALDSLERESERDPGELTRQEARVLEAVAAGKRNKEIAAELAIAEATVKSHLHRVYKKLNVSDRLQAGLTLARYGWPGPVPPELGREPRGGGPLTQELTFPPIGAEIET